VSTIEERVAALEAQVAALTARRERPAPNDRAAAPSAKDVFWALEGLKERLPDPAGAVLYTGVVEAREGEPYEWQYGATVAELLDADWSEYASTLGALAHPVRLLLLREVLGGRRGAAELAEVEGLGTSGQLYHHLRQLVSAGWLRTTGRGSYAVPPERVVPLLVTITAARR
jgi:hypothetical protein